MKKIFLLSLSVLFYFFGRTQQFEMLAEQYPFYSILEWKGMGAILLNRDPSGVAKKVNLTLVGNKTTSIWQQSFNPNGKDFYYITSENARYSYFLDNLNLEGGKVSLHQLNSAGNIKSTSVLLNTAIKKLGEYDPTQLQLMDVVTTDKALVHIFRYHDTKAKKYTEIATFITHHNMLVYATVLGEVTELSLKEGNYGQWQYCGFTEDQICFAARDFQNKHKGWTVKNFTSKATLTEARFIEGPTEKFELVEQVGLGANGKTILAKQNDVETANVIFHNNEYYLVGITAEGTSKSVHMKQLKEGSWKEIQSFALTADPSKKALQFGTYALNEGIGCKIGNSVIFLPFGTGKKAIRNTFSPRFNTNPSRFILEEKKELFAVSLADGNLFFDLNQLNKAGNVKFEFVKK